MRGLGAVSISRHRMGNLYRRLSKNAHGPSYSFIAHNTPICIAPVLAYSITGVSVGI
jgi:hypothetical protein